jgi:activating signal cointegrator complex subunit 1
VKSQAIKTDLDYSHFVSLPLGIYPELVDKLVDFPNSILGINYVSVDANVESNYNEDTSDIKNKGQELIEGDDEAVELKAEDDNHVKVDLTSIPFVSYPPKPRRLPNASGRF